MLGGAWPVIVDDDQRACMELDVVRFDEIAPRGYNASALAHGADWTTDWWPAGCFDLAYTLGVLDNAHYDAPYPVSGANGRLALLGYTRDAYGSPMGGATVKLFRTVDDSLQNTVVSDANGLYSVTSPYADGHYLIVYKAGPPDVCGTTVNTLAPG